MNWTKESIKQRIRDMVPDEGCHKDGQCLYRNENGKGCAAGAFIEDADYSPEFDNALIAIGVVSGSYTASKLPEHIRVKFPFDMAHMTRLQITHDSMVERRVGGIPDALCKLVDEWMPE